MMVPLVVPACSEGAFLEPALELVLGLAPDLKLELEEPIHQQGCCCLLPLFTVSIFITSML